MILIQENVLKNKTVYKMVTESFYALIPDIQGV